MVTRVAEVFRLWGGAQGRGTCGHLCKGSRHVFAWTSKSGSVQMWAHMTLTCSSARETLHRYFLAFNCAQFSCPEGENIPSQLPAPHPQCLGPSLRCSMCTRDWGFWAWELGGTHLAPSPLSPDWSPKVPPPFSRGRHRAQALKKRLLNWPRPLLSFCSFALSLQKYSHDAPFGH